MYRDRTYCSHSFTLGGDCIENCYRLLTVDDMERAKELGLEFSIADLKGSDQCVLVLKEDEDDGK